MKLLFVYGTLKKGYWNHSYLNYPSVSFLGNWVTKPKFTMIDFAGFPAVLPEGETSIKGEVYLVKDDRVMKNICGLEGYIGKDNPNNMYDVLEISTFWGNASMFIMKDNKCRRPVIESGEWSDKELYL